MVAYWRFDRMIVKTCMHHWVMEHFGGLQTSQLKGDICCASTNSNASSISFPELRSPWPAVGKRELWEHPFSNNNGNNRILHIRFYCACARSAQSAFMVSMAHAWNGCSQSSRFPTVGQGERSSGNEIDASCRRSPDWCIVKHES